MKSLAVAAFLLLVSPSLAHAQVTMTVREVPLDGERALASAGTPRFDLVGVHWRGAGSVEFRTRSLAGRWSAWHPAAPEAEDGPDRSIQPGWRIGNPYWTGAANGIAYRLRGRVTRLRAYFVWSPVDALPPRSLSIAGSPAIIPRPSWGADESIRRAAPRYALAVRYAIVHHTAGSNAYSPWESAAIVRGIEVYHVQGNGWDDIGYNFLVDRYGQVFEGRYGGIDKPVIGAHAEGFNDGSVGVAVIGTYNDSPPPAAAQNALTNLLAWRLDVAHVDPLSTLLVDSGGNPRYPVGVPVWLRAISGHRDTGFTDCPGNALYARLAAIASGVAAIGLPKLYAPTVTGAPGGPVEFTAHLSAALPWTVTVTDSTGVVVASGSGEGTAVDWTWDATSVTPARYGWTIAAGDSVRPATGFVGAAPVPLALTSPSVSPGTIAPTGAGTNDRATVTYTLTTAATVTAVLEGPDGTQLATLFSARRPAGKQTFAFSTDGVADGRYQIVISATDGKTTAMATVPVGVDRTVSSFTAAPLVFSPNGDGRKDSITFSFQLARPAHVRLDVRRNARAVTAVSVADLGAGAQSVTWDGSTPHGRVPDGSYSGAVTATSPFGTTVHSVSFRVDTIAPRLRAISFLRLVFWISEAAQVRLTVDGSSYARSVRAGVFSLRLSRLARHVAVTATDPAGNVSRTLRFP